MRLAVMLVLREEASSACGESQPEDLTGCGMLVSW